MFVLCAASYVLLFLVFLKIVSKLTRARCKSKVCLVGKVALVTGGSSGIGYEIVLKLASRGCKVIVADKVIDEDIKVKVEKETNNPNIIFEYVDLASFKSVRKLTEKINRSEEKLDILINNAGIPRSSEIPTEDGFNPTMQINYYSHFLLTHLLVGLLKKSPAARIIFTSSANAYFHRISPENIGPLEIKEEKIPLFNYMNSKFCLVIASDIFADLLKKYNITSNAFHPGVVRTDIVKKYYQQNLTWWERISMPLITLLYLSIGKSPEDGAEIAIHIATSNKMELITGKFFIATVPFIKPRGTFNNELRDEIWRLSENIVKLTPAEKLKSVGVK
nr:retinol dehydrogenase 12-like [Leptinotarsa decemlineata]